MSSTVNRAIFYVGDRTLGAVGAARDLAHVFVSAIGGAIYGYWRGPRTPGAISRQMHAVGNRSLGFVAVTLGFVGMVMVYQTCLLTTQVVDGRGMVGAQFARLLVLDAGPSLTAMMLATRVGAGIAAEIGSMKVTEQIDALRMSGVEPVAYLVVPRLFGCVLMMPVLTMFGMAIAWSTGGLTGYYSFDINPRIYFDLGMVAPGHVVLCMVKAVTFGVAIPIVSGVCGLRARGGAEGVGWATTAAVIGSSLAVIILDLIISVIALVSFGVGL